MNVGRSGQRVSYLGLFARFTARDITSQRNRGMLGWAWFGITPLLLLSVYWLVFGIIFRARVPAGLEIPFAAWLAAGLWPWLAFSDALQKGAHSIRQNAALIAKVALPRSVLTASSQTAAFLMQLIGYAVVLLVLVAIGINLSLVSLPYLGLILLALYVFSLGLAYFLAALQVFLRDLEQFVPTFLTFWFFLTPILYSPEMLPPSLGRLLQLNPMTWWIEEIRAALFLGKSLPDASFLILAAAAAVSFWTGKAIFDRLSPYFEDFL